MADDKSALKAKLMAMHGRLFTRDDYLSLAQCAAVADVELKLAESNYGAVLGELRTEDMHREPIERKLSLSLANDFARIVSFEGDFKAKQYLDAFFLKNQIDILKLMLTSIFDKRDENSVYSAAELYTLLGKKRSFDVPKLIASTTVAEFADNLRGTEFYDVLTRHFKGAEEPTLFQLEVELDIYYYVNLRRVQKKYLDKKSLTVAEMVNGTEIDVRNITWLYRLKRYFGISSSTVFAYLIPYSFRVTKNELARMAEAKDTAEMDAVIASGSYADAFADKERIEKGFYAAMKRALTKAHTTGTGLNAAAAYLRLKEFEIKNITSIIEGKRYGLNAEDTMKQLVAV